MLLAAVNALFAMGAFTIALQAFRKGLPFVRNGWIILQTQTQYPDYRTNVERRRAVQEGGRFLIGGILWLVMSLGALLAAGYFGAQAFTLLYS
jgi:hypothetical protein